MSTFNLPNITISGNNVSVTTQSNGQINIAVPGVQFDVPVLNLPVSNFIVSASMATDFYLQEDTLITSSQVSVSANDASTNQELTFWLTDVTFPYSIIDSGSSALIYSTSIGKPAKINTKFNGTNWELNSFKRLMPNSSSVTTQEAIFENLGLIFDIDPNASTSTLSTGSINFIQNVLSTQCTLTGSGHTPSLEVNGWSSGISSITLTGSTTYNANATQYLINSDGNNNGVFSQLSCGSNFSAWTVFIVFKLIDFSSVEQGLFGLHNANNNPSFIFVTHPTNYEIAVWNDSLAGNTGTVFGTPDTNKHIFDVSADGAGNLNGWFDGVQVVTNESDVHPKTIGQLTLGSVNPTQSAWTEEVNGRFARVLIFNRNLTSTQRQAVRNMLNTTYSVF